MLFSLICPPIVTDFLNITVNGSVKEFFDCSVTQKEDIITQGFGQNIPQSVCQRNRLFAHLSIGNTLVEKAFFHLFERVVMGVFHHSVRHINDFGFIVIDPFGVFGILDLIVEWFCEQIRPAETRRNQREKHIPACRSFPAAKGTLIIFPHTLSPTQTSPSRPNARAGGLWNVAVPR